LEGRAPSRPKLQAQRAVSDTKAATPQKWDGSAIHPYPFFSKGNGVETSSMRKPTLRLHGRVDHAPLHRRNKAARALQIMNQWHHRIAHIVTTGLPVRTTESTKKDKRVMLSVIVFGIQTHLILDLAFQRLLWLKAEFQRSNNDMNRDQNIVIQSQPK